MTQPCTVTWVEVGGQEGRSGQRPPRTRCRGRGSVHAACRRCPAPRLGQGGEDSGRAEGQ